MHTLARRLLAWYDRSHRKLPWRAPPRSRADPYAVWLSEIMLQRTTVAAVESYFTAFLQRWPTVEALAQAPLDDVLAAWAGLGYYARARNLHACARLIAEKFEGRFPDEEAALMRLPGVGPYTAAAIAAIAFDRPCVAQDGNVERVVARLFAISTPLPRAKAEIRERAASFLARERPGDFAQALMDLGATICTPRAPQCLLCPLAADCAAAQLQRPEAFPVKPEKIKKPHRRGAAFVLWRGDKVLLRRRPEKGLLGGMFGFPSTPLEQDVSPQEFAAHAPMKARWRPLPGAVRHVFTHFSLELCVFAAEIAKPPSIGENCRWANACGMDKEGLPTLMRKVAVHAGLIRA